MGIYVGDEACIDLEDGTRVYILHDLPQGADDDLTEEEQAGLAEGGYVIDVEKEE